MNTSNNEFKFHNSSNIDNFSKIQDFFNKLVLRSLNNLFILIVKDVRRIDGDFQIIDLDRPVIPKPQIRKNRRDFVELKEKLNGKLYCFNNNLDEYRYLHHFRQELNWKENFNELNLQIQYVNKDYTKKIAKIVKEDISKSINGENLEGINREISYEINEDILNQEDFAFIKLLFRDLQVFYSNGKKNLTINVEKENKRRFIGQTENKSDESKIFTLKNICSEIIHKIINKKELKNEIKKINIRNKKKGSSREGKKLDFNKLEQKKWNLIKESYLLNIKKNGIMIIGLSESGLYYSLTTLSQLIHKNQNRWVIQETEILDYPSFEFRGITKQLHHGHVPTIETLKKIIRTLARYKQNTIGLNLEDIMPFDNFPFLGKNRGRLTNTEIQELIDWAKFHYVEIVPGFQSLGHLESLLRTPELSDLAEFPGAGTLNLGNPKTREFLIECYSEIIEKFKPKIINIELNEAYHFAMGFSKEWMIKKYYSNKENNEKNKNNRMKENNRKKEYNRKKENIKSKEINEYLLNDVKIGKRKLEYFLNKGLESFKGIDIKSKIILDHVNWLFSLLTRKFKIENIWMYHDTILFLAFSKINELPEKLGLIFWEYSIKKSKHKTLILNQLRNNLQIFKPIIVSSSLANWGRSFPNIELAYKNSQEMAYLGKKKSANGMLISILDNLDNENLHELDYFGLALPFSWTWNAPKKRTFSIYNIETVRLIRAFSIDYFGMEQGHLLWEGLFQLGRLTSNYNKPNRGFSTPFYQNLWAHPFAGYIPKTFYKRKKLEKAINQVLLSKEMIGTASKTIIRNKNLIEYLNFALDLTKFNFEKQRLTIELLNYWKNYSKIKPDLIKIIKEQIEQIKVLKGQNEKLWSSCAKTDGWEWISKKYDNLLTEYNRILFFAKKQWDYIKGTRRALKAEQPLILSKWIRYQKSRIADQLHTPITFRKKILIDEKRFNNISIAKLQIIPRCHAKLYVNKSFVGEVIARYYPSPVIFDNSVKIFDIKSYLKPGKNIIEIEGYEYTGFEISVNVYGEIRILIHKDKDKIERKKETKKRIEEIKKRNEEEIEKTEEQLLRIISDESWSAKKGKISENEIFKPIVIFKKINSIEIWSSDLVRDITSRVDRNLHIDIYNAIKKKIIMNSDFMKFLLNFLII